MTKSLLQINVRRLVKKFEISKEFLDDMEQESKILDEFIERRKKTYNVLFSSNVKPIHLCKKKLNQDNFLAYNA
jgi:hypothetical protein